jgi:putative heme iron utilization protein
MSEQFSTEVSDRICKHMNEDHADAVALYAQSFGNSPETEAARMVSIDAQGMNLMTQVNGTSAPLRIEFDHVLNDAEDAHHTLVDMLKQARGSFKSN